MSLKKTFLAITFFTLIAYARQPESFVTQVAQTLTTTPTLSSKPTTSTIPQPTKSVVAIPAVAVSATPTQRTTTVTFSSPNRKWIVQSTTTISTVSDPFVEPERYDSVRIFNRDGTSEWLVYKSYNNSAWPLTFIPFYWSPTGRYFYFTYDEHPDGDTTFVNGSDLRRVDLANGKTQLIHSFAGYWISLSPSERFVAYINKYNNKLGIRDINTQSTHEVRLQLPFYIAGSIIWRPDERFLVLTLINIDEAKGKSAIIKVDTRSFAQTVLLTFDDRNLQTINWTKSGSILLKEISSTNNVVWRMNPNTGEITPAK